MILSKRKLKIRFKRFLFDFLNPEITDRLIN